MGWKDKRTGFCLASILMVFGGALLLLSGCKKESKGEEAPPPPAVEVVDVIQKDVPVYSEWIASTDGFVNATIRAQVQGYLITRNYKEGDFVKKGQILFEIDPRPFEAALDQARRLEPDQGHPGSVPGHLGTRPKPRWSGWRRNTSSPRPT